MNGRWMGRMGVAYLLVHGLSAQAQQPVPYPATTGGEALRRFYEAPVKEMGEAADALHGITDQKVRQSLEPAMLAIIARDSSYKGVAVAMMLAEWNPDLALTAKEFRNLVPAIAQGLRNGNDVKEDGTQMPAAIVSVFLLARMNREAGLPIKKEMYACFNAPAKEPIEGESQECWTRGILALLIPTFGEEGIAEVARGLDSTDALMRVFALNGVSGTGELSVPEGWEISPEQLAAQREFARYWLPRMVELMADKDSRVEEAAWSAVGAVIKPADANPPLVEKLFALKAYGILAKLHPAATARLMTLALGADEAESRRARTALSGIGGPLVGELLGQLGKPGVSKETIVAILGKMGAGALPALAAAAKADPKSDAGAVATAAYAEVFEAQQAPIRGITGALQREHLTRWLFKMLMAQLEPMVPAAEAALPVLQEVAEKDADAGVRKLAQDMVERIKKETLPAKAGG